MEHEKIVKSLRFYLLANQLKDKLRSGWTQWNIDRKRVESVAEHIYGTCILAIAIDSEFDLNVDLYKVVMMLVLHEIEEVKIGDITPFDNITKQEKRKLGRQAVEEVLGSLSKKDDDIENSQTRKSKFAKMCDKLEADIQVKLYCEEKSLDINKKENANNLEDKRVQSLLENGEKTVADLFIEYSRPVFTEEIFKNIVDFVKNGDLLNLK